MRTKRLSAEEAAAMSEIVKCDICGGVYNQRHLSSHKRLSHSKTRTSSPPAADDPEKLEALLSLYEQLSDAGKKEVLDQLTSAEQKRK
jgi:hypothetical protein